MNNTMILLTPVLVFILVGLFAFVGCSSFSSAPEEEKPKTPEQTPPPDQPPVTPPVTPPTKPPTYIEVVKATPGFTAIWPLDETIGKIAAVDGLPSTANGTYTNSAGADPTPGTYTLGTAGVLFPKEPDNAAEFMGTEAFIEVPFVSVLNPGPAVPGFSIELWAKPNPNAGADRGVVVSSHHFDSMTSQQGYEIGLLKDPDPGKHHKIYARVYGGSASLQTEITVQPDEGLPTDWRHIVFRYGFVAGTGYVIRLRVQVLKGVKLFEVQSAPGVVYEQVTMAKQSTLRFAGSHLPPPATSALFAGQLDNIAFYNALISDGDINTHFGMA